MLARAGKLRSSEFTRNKRDLTWFFEKNRSLEPGLPNRMLAPIRSLVVVASEICFGPVALCWIYARVFDV